MAGWGRRRGYCPACWMGVALSLTALGLSCVTHPGASEDPVPAQATSVVAHPPGSKGVPFLVRLATQRGSLPPWLGRKMSLP